MDLVLPLLLLGALVVLVAGWPLLRPAVEAEDPDDDRRRALEAAKEAKYREIRDAELDHRMGKLSEPDWRSLDRELRGQAIEILKQLEALDA